MAQVGYAGKVEIAPDSSAAPGTYAELGGESKGSITIKAAALDVTEFNSPGYMMRMLGLLDVDINVECFRDPADTAQTTCVSAITGRTRVWVKVYQDATHNVEAAAYVTEFPFEADPASAEKVAIKFVFDGTPDTPLTVT